MADSGSEKTEQATERQIERFREQGRVAEARELVAAISMGAGVLAFVAAGPMFVDGMGALLHYTRARSADRELDHEAVTALVAMAARTSLPPLLLVLLASTIATALVGSAITGFNVAPDALTPKWERLDVFASAKQIYGSTQPLIALVKSSVIASLLAWTTWSCISEHFDAIPPLAVATVPAQLRFAVDLALDFAKRILPVALAVGAADYLWQRYKHGESMMMDKQEVKQEHKETDGDPHIRARRRQRQRQLAMGGMLAKVRDAQVVITNPTHYAIALRYKREESAAPIVLARGVDHVALRIRAEATKYEIPIIENRVLARALYAGARLGYPIPAEFYAPVAQVLAIVLRQRRRSVKLDTRPTPVN